MISLVNSVIEGVFSYAHSIDWLEGVWSVLQLGEFQVILFSISNHFGYEDLLECIV